MSSALAAGSILCPNWCGSSGWISTRPKGTSPGALHAPVGIFAFYEYYLKGNADIRVAALLALGFLVIAYLGAVGAQHISELWLRRFFAAALIAVGRGLLFTK